MSAIRMAASSGAFAATAGNASGAIANPIEISDANRNFNNRETLILPGQSHNPPRGKSPEGSLLRNFALVACGDTIGGRWREHVLPQGDTGDDAAEGQ
jgi:hypothetical protein